MTMPTLDRDSYKELLWKKIDTARKNKSLSWTRFSRLLGLNRRTVCLMRANKTEPRPSRCLEIAGVLGLTCDELLDPRIDVPETWRTDPENKYFPANSAARFWERKREIAELGTKEYYRRVEEKSQKAAALDMANMQ